MFVPHSEHSQKVDYEKSENILAKTLRIESGPPSRGASLPLLEKGDVTATYRKLGPKNRGFFSFRVVSV